MTVLIYMTKFIRCFEAVRHDWRLHVLCVKFLPVNDYLVIFVVCEIKSDMKHECLR